jgi:hypothetical protein
MLRKSPLIILFLSMFMIIETVGATRNLLQDTVTSISEGGTYILRSKLDQSKVIGIGPDGDLYLYSYTPSSPQQRFKLRKIQGVGAFGSEYGDWYDVQLYNGLYLTIKGHTNSALEHFNGQPFDQQLTSQKFMFNQIGPG